MKKFLLFLSLTLSFTHAYSQDSAYSILDRTEIIWQKVFETNFSFPELYFNLRKSGFFSEIDTLNGSILGQIRKSEFDVSQSNETIWKSKIPLYIKMCDITAAFVVNYKPGRYQVIVSNIRTIGKAENPKNNILLVKPDEQHSLSFWALKNQKLAFNKSFINYSMPIITQTFSQKFIIKDIKTKEW